MWKTGISSLSFSLVNYIDFIYYSGYEQLPERSLLLHGRIQPDKSHTGCLCFGDGDVTIPCVVSCVRNVYERMKRKGRERHAEAGGGGGGGRDKQCQNNGSWFVFVSKKNM